MNRKAIISGQEYALLEIVLSLMESRRCLFVKMKTAKGRYAPSRCDATVL